MFVEFSKQKIFTYPFPSKFIGICHRNGNLLSKQSVLRGDEITPQDSAKLKATVVPAKSDSDVMFCLQSYQGRRIDRSLVY